jgi:hypothetical protein
VTEDRTTAVLGRAQPAPPQRAPRRTGPWFGVDERSMRWAVLGAFLLGVYAVLFVLLGVWLTP